MIKGLIILFLALVQLPIGFYMQYQILQRVHASELMWFFFWSTVPMAILITSLSTLLQIENKKK